LPKTPNYTSCEIHRRCSGNGYATSWCFISKRRVSRSRALCERGLGNYLRALNLGRIARLVGILCMGRFRGFLRGSRTGLFLLYPRILPWPSEVNRPLPPFRLRFLHLRWCSAPVWCFAPEPDSLPSEDTSVRPPDTSFRLCTALNFTMTSALCLRIEM